MREHLEPAGEIFSLLKDRFCPLFEPRTEFRYLFMAQRFASIPRIHAIPFPIKCRRVGTRKRNRDGMAQINAS